MNAPIKQFVPKSFKPVVALLVTKGIYQKLVEIIKGFPVERTPDINLGDGFSPHISIEQNTMMLPEPQLLLKEEARATVTTDTFWAPITPDKSYIAKDEDGNFWEYDRQRFEDIFRESSTPGIVMEIKTEKDANDVVDFLTQYKNLKFAKVHLTEKVFGGTVDVLDIREKQDEDDGQK